MNSAILMVYSTGNKYYQYEIVLWNGLIYQPNELYETSKQAHNVAVERIKIVIGYQ